MNIKPDLQTHLDYLENHHLRMIEYFHERGLSKDVIAQDILEKNRTAIDERRKAYERMSKTIDREYGQRSNRETGSAHPWDPNVEVPQMKDEFTRAHDDVNKDKPKGQTKVRKKAARDLKIDPPRPKGMGEGESPQVSRQNRGVTRDSNLKERLQKARDDRGNGRDGNGR